MLRTAPFDCMVYTCYFFVLYHINSNVPIKLWVLLYRRLQRWGLQPPAWVFLLNFFRIAIIIGGVLAVDRHLRPGGIWNLWCFGPALLAIWVCVLLYENILLGMPTSGRRRGWPQYAENCSLFRCSQASF